MEGIVLKAYDYKESSRMVDLYSLEEGRLTFSARGAKRNKSRITNLTEPFVEGEFNLVKGRSDIPYLKDGQVKNAHLGLREKIERLVGAAFTIDLMQDALVAFPAPDLYALLQAQLACLELVGKEALPRLLAAFLLKLVSVMGFRPSLGHCILCNRAITGRMVGEGLTFDLQGGGVICPNHDQGGGVYLTSWAYQEVVTYISQPLNDIINKLDTKKTDQYLEMERTCLKYYQVHTNRFRLKSAGMMTQLGLL